MSWPQSLTTRTVTARVVTYPDGVGARATARFVLDKPMQGPTDNAFVAPFDFTIDFVDGKISVVLPANDDPQWTPSFYRVTITTFDDARMLSEREPRLHGGTTILRRGKEMRNKLVLPYNSTEPIDLADVFNLPPATPGESYVLLSSKGVAGGVASLGSDGKVPASQLSSGGGGSVSWIDLTDKPSTFPPSTHTHAQSDVTGLTVALSAKADASTTTAALATKADASTVTSALASKADLVGGVVPTSQIPSIAVVDFLGSVSTQVAMLALTGQKGDWCIRTDLGQTFVITGSDPTQLGSWTAMPLGISPVQSVNGQTGTVVLGKTDVGLGNVDNTSDANKPVSTAQTTALALKAPLASPTFTGTVSGVTPAMVGLGNVTNTSDANKPVSTAQQTALDLKAPLASPALTGTPTAPTASGGTNTTQVATTAFVTAAVAAAVAADTPKILVLAAAASVPGGTPAGTVIIRTVT